MASFLTFLQNHLPALVDYKYLFLFLGAAIEGMNTIVVAGFLVSVGAVKLWPTFALAVFGHTLNGYAWYAVGYYAGHKALDRWVRKDEKGRKILEVVERYLHRYSGRAIMITKFTFSLEIATLIMTGSIKYNLKKFSLYNFLGSLGWVIITMSVGIFFGESYQLLLVYLRNFTYFMLFLAGAIALVYFIKIILRSTFITSLQLSEKLREIGGRLRERLDGLMADED